MVQWEKEDKTQTAIMLTGEWGGLENHIMLNMNLLRF